MATRNLIWYLIEGFSKRNAPGLLAFHIIDTEGWAGIYLTNKRLHRIGIHKGLTSQMPGEPSTPERNPGISVHSADHSAQIRSLTEHINSLYTKIFGNISNLPDDEFSVNAINQIRLQDGMAQKALAVMPYYEAVSTDYTSLITYNMERENASELDQRIPQILSRMDLVSEIYRPEGDRLNVSSDVLESLMSALDATMEMALQQLSRVSFTGESMYYKRANDQLAETQDKMYNFFFHVLSPGFHQVASDFEQGMAVLRDAHYDYGEQMSADSVQWEFSDSYETMTGRGSF